MEYTEEIIQTLVKINEFIQENNNVNYKIRLLEREVPNLQDLVKKLTTPTVIPLLPTDEECINAVSRQIEYIGFKIIDVKNGNQV
jgi:hypothetical protein